MSDEITEHTILVGTRLTDAEVAALDPKDIGHLQAQPKRFEVEGESNIYCYCFHLCPCCGCASADPALSTATFHYYICHCCGGVYRA